MHAIFILFFKGDSTKKVCVFVYFLRRFSVWCAHKTNTYSPLVVVDHFAYRMWAGGTYVQHWSDSNEFSSQYNHDKSHFILFTSNRAETKGRIAWLFWRTQQKVSRQLIFIDETNINIGIIFKYFFLIKNACMWEWREIYCVAFR